jgi:predicted lysophospholipase L1 biosynthesis ABC-type transport system permease subunit
MFQIAAICKQAANQLPAAPLQWNVRIQSLLACCLLLTAACAADPPRTADEIRADAALSARLHSALAADTVFYFAHVDIAADRGVVTLTGYVQTQEAKFQARRLAEAAGAARVIDLVKLDREDKHP